MTFYRLLADIAVIIHFLWILFLIFGVIWGRKNKKIRIVHISGLIFAIIIQIFEWYCPLTHLEVWLRSKYSQDSTIIDSFIIYYLEKIIYLNISPKIIFPITLLLSFFNFYIYFKQYIRKFRNLFKL